MREHPELASSHVAIVTHADEQVGLGHVMRQLAIADRAQRLGARASVISDAPLVADICADQGVEHHKVDCLDARYVEPVLSAERPDRLIIDVHESRVSGLAELSDRWPSTYVVSEVGYEAPHVGEHVVLLGTGLDRWRNTELNQNGTRVHTGRAFVVFRDEFATPRTVLRMDDRVLLAHGGADPHRLTYRSMLALDRIRRRLQVDVLVGRAFSDVDRLLNLANCSHHRYQLHYSPDRSADLMRGASVALINGGNVRYELCLTATPFIALSFNQRQRLCTQQMTQLGAGLDLGVVDQLSDDTIAASVEKLLDDSATREAMREAMLGLFDMEGATRILTLSTYPHITGGHHGA